MAYENVIDQVTIKFIPQRFKAAYQMSSLFISTLTLRPTYVQRSRRSCLLPPCSYCLLLYSFSLLCNCSSRNRKSNRSHELAGQVPQTPVRVTASSAMVLLALLLGLLLPQSHAQTLAPTLQPTASPQSTSVPSILPTTSAQLSPSTSVTSQYSTPTTTSLATNDGLYSFSFSFRRLTESALPGTEFDYSEFQQFTRVQGAPVIDYVAIAISPDELKWIAISKEGVIYISLDRGLSWIEGITIPGANKVIFNGLGKVVILSVPITFNGTAYNGVNVALDLEQLLLHPSPSNAPSASPINYVPSCSSTGGGCNGCGASRNSRTTRTTSSYSQIFTNSSSITETSWYV